MYWIFSSTNSFLNTGLTSWSPKLDQYVNKLYFTIFCGSPTSKCWKPLLLKPRYAELETYHRGFFFYVIFSIFMDSWHSFFPHLDFTADLILLQLCKLPLVCIIVLQVSIFLEVSHFSFCFSKLALRTCCYFPVIVK